MVAEKEEEEEEADVVVVVVVMLLVVCSNIGPLEAWRMEMLCNDF